MKNLKTLGYVFGILLVLVVGFKLRLRDYNLIPFPGESTDEYSNSWVGLSLIELGTPIGISDLSGYESNIYRYINVDRIYQSVSSSGPLLLHKPWFDHPPTLGLITGGFAYMKGARVFEDASTGIIRKPMVYLGTLTTLLVVILALIVSGPWASLLSGAIYATSPILIISSRMIQAENGYLPLMLVSLICLALFEKYKGEKYLWMAGLFSALSITIKIPGVITSIVGVVILMTQVKKNNDQKYKEVVLFGAISALGLIAFIVYGAALDWETFKNILFSNSSRVYGIGFDAINDLLVHTKITGQKILTDGWPILGWLSMWMLKPDKKTLLYRYLALPVFLYLIVYLLVGSQPYGWYRIPFMPFLYISLSAFLVDALKDKNLTIAAVLGLLIPIGINLQKISNISNTQDILRVWKLGILGLATILVTSLIFQKVNSKTIGLLPKISLVLLLALAIYFNLRYNSLITVDYWYKSS